MGVEPPTADVAMIDMKSTNGANVVVTMTTL